MVLFYAVAIAGVAIIGGAVIHRVVSAVVKADSPESAVDKVQAAFEYEIEDEGYDPSLFEFLSHVTEVKDA